MHTGTLFLHYWVEHVYKHQERNLTTIAKMLRSSSHGEVQLKLFDGEAAHILLY